MGMMSQESSEQNGQNDPINSNANNNNNGKVVDEGNNLWNNSIGTSQLLTPLNSQSESVAVGSEQNDTETAADQQATRKRGEEGQSQSFHLSAGSQQQQQQRQTQGTTSPTRHIQSDTDAASSHRQREQHTRELTPPQTQGEGGGEHEGKQSPEESSATRHDASQTSMTEPFSKDEGALVNGVNDVVEEQPQDHDGEEEEEGEVNVDEETQTLRMSQVLMIKTMDEEYSQSVDDKTEVGDDDEGGATDEKDDEVIVAETADGSDEVAVGENKTEATREPEKEDTVTAGDGKAIDNTTEVDTESSYQTVKENKRTSPTKLPKASSDMEVDETCGAKSDTEMSSNEGGEKLTNDNVLNEEVEAAQDVNNTAMFEVEEEGAAQNHKGGESGSDEDYFDDDPMGTQEMVSSRETDNYGASNGLLTQAVDSGDEMSTGEDREDGDATMVERTIASFIRPSNVDVAEGYEPLSGLTEPSQSTNNLEGLPSISFTAGNAKRKMEAKDTNTSQVNGDRAEDGGDEHNSVAEEEDDAASASTPVVDNRDKSQLTADEGKVESDVAPSSQEEKKEESDDETAGGTDDNLYGGETQTLPSGSSQRLASKQQQASIDDDVVEELSNETEEDLYNQRTHQIEAPKPSTPIATENDMEDDIFNQETQQIVATKPTVNPNGSAKEQDHGSVAEQDATVLGAADTSGAHKDMHVNTAVTKALAKESEANPTSNVHDDDFGESQDLLEISPFKPAQAAARKTDAKADNEELSRKTSPAMQTTGVAPPKKSPAIESKQPTNKPAEETKQPANQTATKTVNESQWMSITRHMHREEVAECNSSPRLAMPKFKTSEKKSSPALDSADDKQNLAGDGSDDDSWFGNGQNDDVHDDIEDTQPTQDTLHEQQRSASLKRLSRATSTSSTYETFSSRNHSKSGNAGRSGGKKKAITPKALHIQEKNYKLDDASSESLSGESEEEESDEEHDNPPYEQSQTNNRAMKQLMEVKRLAKELPSAKELRKIASRQHLSDEIALLKKAHAAEVKGLKQKVSNLKAMIKDRDASLEVSGRVSMNILCLCILISNPLPYLACITGKECYHQ